MQPFHIVFSFEILQVLSPGPPNYSVHRLILTLGEGLLLPFTVSCNYSIACSLLVHWFRTDPKSLLTCLQAIKNSLTPWKETPGSVWLGDSGSRSLHPTAYPPALCYLFSDAVYNRSADANAIFPHHVTPYPPTSLRPVSIPHFMFFPFSPNLIRLSAYSSM